MACEMRHCASDSSGGQRTCVHGRFSDDAADFVLFDRVGNPSDGSSQYEQRVLAIQAETPSQIDVGQCEVRFESLGIVDDGDGALKFSVVGIVGENLVEAPKHGARARVAIL